MKTGQQLGPFVIEKALGSGAMGAVYRAKYTKTGAPVALKVISFTLADNENSLRRFKREAEILKQLNHPNIVRFYGYGRTPEGMPFYAMEYLKGESLDQVIQRRDRLTWEEVIALGQQLCAALQHVHEKGIIHRDLKPSNIMVLADGSIKLTDFGIAKDMDKTQLTAAHCTVGTASYMSPEQCRGERDITSKSDLYSMGCMLYELLTGKRPFDAETPMEMFMHHINDVPEPPGRIVLDIPPGLDTVVCQLMEKKPDKRGFNAERVAEELRLVAENATALKSAGVDLVQRRAIDRPGKGAALDETDKEAARTLRQAVTGKKVRKRKKPNYRWVAIQATALAALVVIGVVIISLAVFRKPSQDALYQESQKLMASKNPEDWDKANDRDGPLAKYLRYYPTGPHVDQVKAWSDQADVYDLEQKLPKLVHSHKGQGLIKPLEGAETEALDAALAEDKGDLETAGQIWQKIEQDYKDRERIWTLVADKRLQEVKEAEALSGRIDVDLQKNLQFLAETETEQQALAGFECERKSGSDKARRECWQGLKDKYQDDREHRVLFLLAAQRARPLPKPTEEPEKKPEPAPEKEKPAQ